MGTGKESGSRTTAASARCAPDGEVPVRRAGPAREVIQKSPALAPPYFRAKGTGASLRRVIISSVGRSVDRSIVVRSTRIVREGH
jgi:hypothetical protein